MEGGFRGQEITSEVKRQLWGRDDLSRSLKDPYIVHMWEWREERLGMIVDAKVDTQDGSSD